MNLPTGTPSQIQDRSAELTKILGDFGVMAAIHDFVPGFSVTTYRLKMSEGKSVKTVASAAEDIAAQLGVKAVQVGRAGSFVTIQVPNSQKGTLLMGDIFTSSEYELPMFLGVDSSNAPIIHDLAQAPHLLIGGKTGSGKSVGIHAIITSLALSRTPNDLGMIMVDPKIVELGAYTDLAHLERPIINDPAEATAMLAEMCTEMDRRYSMMAKNRVRNIGEYRAMGGTMKYLVIVIDELADLMMTSGKETESHIVRLTQKARAAGIHLVVATQRPEVKVVAGLIKANIPGRIAYATTTGIDSKVILDEQGAENLMGKGDMLVHIGSDTVRGQGVFIGSDVINMAVEKYTKAKKEVVLPKVEKAAKTEPKKGLVDSLVSTVFQLAQRKAGFRKGRKTVGEKNVEALLKNFF